MVRYSIESPQSNLWRRQGLADADASTQVDAVTETADGGGASRTADTHTAHKQLLPIGKLAVP